MVRGVAGRIDAFYCPAVALDNVAVPDLDIGHELHITVFFDLHIVAAVLARAMGTESVGFRAGQRLERLCGRRVIAMRFALQDEKALFTGDHVMGWSTSIVSPPDGNMEQYMASSQPHRHGR